MNRLITPSADTMAASEPQSLRQELIKADQAQQQRFEQALRLGSAQQKRSGPQERLGKPNESRESTPDDDLTGRQGAAEERTRTHKRQARQAPRPKDPFDLPEGREPRISTGENETMMRDRSQGTSSKPAVTIQGPSIFKAQSSETTRDPWVWEPANNQKENESARPADDERIAPGHLLLPMTQATTDLQSTMEQATIARESEWIVHTKIDADALGGTMPQASNGNATVGHAPQPMVADSALLHTEQPDDLLSESRQKVLPVDSRQLAKDHVLPDSGKFASLLNVEPISPKEEPVERAPISDEEVLPEGGSFVGSAIRVPPLTVTPGDLLLARVAPPVEHHELGQLLSRLAVDIQLEVGRPDRPPLLQLTLPALGELAIRIERHQGTLQVEILASEQGQLLLNQGRGELIDRLQRLYPGERVAFDLFTRGDSEQGSRQKRSIYDEWDADA
ncbi:MAG: type III secretion system needle length determinant [Aeromonas sp.]